MCRSRLEIYLAKSVAPVKNKPETKSLDAHSVKEEDRENAVVNFLRKKKGYQYFLEFDDPRIFFMIQIH